MAGSLQRLGYEAWWDLPALPRSTPTTRLLASTSCPVGEHWIRRPPTVGGWTSRGIDDPAFWAEFRGRSGDQTRRRNLVGEIWHVRHWLKGDRFDG